MQNYFTELYPTKPYEENIEVVDTIKIDPLKYGYKKYLDALETGYTIIRQKLFEDTTSEIKGFIEDVIERNTTIVDKKEVERQIKFFNPMM